ncbi:MAG: TonB-dependent receptor [Pyrinomonadaceae bacterium]|nr:TonB-dependent receptor [Pyrinomonadaceae bacterium]
MKRIVFSTLVLFAFAAIAIAQSTVGSIQGTVSGPDGLLPGATVTITDTQTGRVLTTTSNSSGGFKFEQLPFGVYTVKVTQDGFKAYVANNVKINANQQYTLNPKLELGDVTAEVTVQAGAEIVNSSTAELSTTVSPKQVLDLPINGRNPLSLINLQAGANSTAGNHINGQRTSSVNFTRDGINVQDNFIRTGGFVQDRPTVDDTGEFAVVTQNAGAELGNGGSAQVLLVTPRGGNEFHGAAYIYNRNSEFAANEFGNNASGVDKPFLNRNQIGGKLSGPMPLPGIGEGTPYLFKDKGFFFVNYERFLLRQTNSANTRILLPQFRDGTFNYTDAGGTARTVNVLTGAGMTGAIPAFANGPIAGVDNTIQNRILAAMPTTGNGSILNGGLTQDLLFNVRDNTTRDTFTTRIDAEINDKHSIYGTFRYVDNVDNRPDVEFGFEPEPFVNVTSTTRFFVGAWRSIIGSSITNEFRVAYNDSNPFFAESPNFPQDFVIGGLPFGITDPLPSFQDQGRVTNQYTIQNNASYSTGNHTMRFGGEYIKQVIDTQTNFNRVPIYTISAGNTRFDSLDSGLFPGGIGGTDLGRASALRGFLAGFIGGGTVAAQYQGPALGPVLGSTNQENFRYSTTGLYFSDQWRVKPNLTLTLGARWDYWSPLNNPDQVYLEPDLEGATDFETIRTNMLDPTGQYAIIGTNSGKPGDFYKPDYDNIGPNIGIAWSPSFDSGPLRWLFGEQGRSTIRGGFRIGYINDEFVRGSDNALGGNQGLDFTVRALQGGSPTLNARLDNLPGFVLPPFQQPPISFATGNANNGFFFNTVFAVDPKLEMQQNYQYNFGYQREIGFDTAIEVRYVGGHSNNMHQAFDFNQVNIDANNFLNDFITARNNCLAYIAASNANPANPTRYLDGRCSTNEYRGTAGAIPGVTNIAGTLVGELNSRFLRTSTAQGVAGQAAVIWVQNRGLVNAFGFSTDQFLANDNAGVVDLLTNSGRYRYNSLQMEIRRRFTDGLQFQANYTFQKTLTDSGSDNQSRFNPFLDFANQALEYQRADYDRTHTVNINANYELPFGKGKPFLNQGGIVDKIFGGFQLTSIIAISSGAPISIKDINGTLNRTGRSNRQTANSSLSESQIKDLTGIFFDNGNIYYIDPSVIGPSGSATNGNVTGTPDDRFPGQVFFRVQPGETGTLQRAFLNGPWYYNVDAGIIKNISFGERFRVQLRAEAFNLLNKTNFFIGENTGTFDVDISTFGRINPTSTFSPRIMQFAFRLEF